MNERTNVKTENSVHKLPALSGNLATGLPTDYTMRKRPFHAYILFQFIILRERERARAHVWGKGRETEGERIPSKVCDQRRAHARLKPTNPKIMT